MSATTKAETGQACLKWGGGSLLLSGPCVIGRRSDNDLQINNVQVSRRHALLMNYNDDWWLNDLGSRNGILVNGIRLTSARRLRNGDEVRIANHRIIFHNSSQSPPHHSSIIGKTTQVAEPASDETSPPAATCELIIATENGEILEGEKAAHWFFGKTVERAPGASCYMLPASVRQWLELVAGGNGAGVSPLEIKSGERRVVMSLARRRDERFFLLVREESAKISIERLQNLDLTEREAEVMHWVCEGKKNPEIAEILAIAPRTVNHHIEHIFKKLGVDNRQKAVKTVMERLAV
ncbi:LuxR C-terminal-related transcriptional regulator [Prosthecobacter sp.]|uniref:LuxR C-terminal-related transcriptional regulator n=1 Tax=Prosthecobacter sp. TaxID=1965333 RepID=UPI002AB8C314|nr:LuxR C-terminal-related transcriptional regulator [Prosthecobacter sp.]MDZ4402066.1 LuxR C-terminal-related transcriptional regulator [Prosthecobacter sp.]